MLTEKQSNQSVDLRRDAWLEIDLDAVRHNINLVKSWTSSPIMGVVKGDGYGHGAFEVAHCLVNEGVEWLCVASAAEAIDLNDYLTKNNLAANILILSPAPDSSLDDLIRTDIGLTVTMMHQIDEIAAAATKLKKKARIHLKLDSGMHRLGAKPQDLDVFLERINNEKSIELLSMYSHLAKSGDETATEFQHKNFSDCLKLVNFEKYKTDKKIFFHLANSEATRKFPFSHYDRVRIGLYLYGLESRADSTDLKPALALKAKITHTTDVKAKEGVGYDWTWVSDKPSRLASVPIGYADGVPRRLSNKIYGYLHGERVLQVGIISMDQMLFDITNVPKAKPGDVITLIDSNYSNASLAHWAALDDTITYELACALALRLPRIYKNK